MREGTESESVQHRGHFKGWERASERGRVREKPLQTEAVVEFRGLSRRVGVFSTLTEEQLHYSFLVAALTQLVKQGKPRSPYLPLCSSSSSSIITPSLTPFTPPPCAKAGCFRRKHGVCRLREEGRGLGGGL